MSSNLISSKKLENKKKKEKLDTYLRMKINFLYRTTSVKNFIVNLNLKFLTSLNSFALLLTSPEKKN